MLLVLWVCLFPSGIDMGGINAPRPHTSAPRSPALITALPLPIRKGGYLGGGGLSCDNSARDSAGVGGWVTRGGFMPPLPDAERTE